MWAVSSHGSFWTSALWRLLSAAFGTLQASPADKVNRTAVCFLTNSCQLLRRKAFQHGGNFNLVKFLPEIKKVQNIRAHWWKPCWRLTQTSLWKLQVFRVQLFVHNTLTTYTMEYGWILIDRIFFTWIKYSQWRLFVRQLLKTHLLHNEAITIIPCLCSDASAALQCMMSEC